MTSFYKKSSFLPSAIPTNTETNPIRNIKKGLSFINNPKPQHAVILH